VQTLSSAIAVTSKLSKSLSLISKPFVQSLTIESAGLADSKIALASFADALSGHFGDSARFQGTNSHFPSGSYRLQSENFNASVRDHDVSAAFDLSEASAISEKPPASERFSLSGNLSKTQTKTASLASSTIITVSINASRSSVLSVEPSASQQSQDTATVEVSLRPSKTTTASINADWSSVISEEPSASQQPQDTATEKVNLASSQTTAVAIGASAAALLLLVAGLLVLLVLKRRKGKTQVEWEEEEEEEADILPETEITRMHLQDLFEWTNPLAIDDSRLHTEEPSEHEDAFNIQDSELAE
jgi:hypothetical protein